MFDFSYSNQRIKGGWGFFERFDYDLMVYFYWLRAVFDAIKYQTVVSAVIVGGVHFDIVSLEYELILTFWCEDTQKEKQG